MRQCAYHEAAAATLETRAAVRSVALTKARLYEADQRRAHATPALSAVMRAAAGRADLASLLEATLDHTMTALGLEMGAIWLRDTPTASPQVVMRGLPPEIGQVSRQVATRAQLELTEPAIVTDWVETEILDPLQEMALRFGIRAFITVPLLAVGQRIGGLSVAVPAPRAWTPDEIALFHAIGHQLEGAVERPCLLAETQPSLAALSARFSGPGALRAAAAVVGATSTTSAWFCMGTTMHPPLRRMNGTAPSARSGAWISTGRMKSWSWCRRSRSM